MSSNEQLHPTGVKSKSILATGPWMTKADVRLSASYELHGIPVWDIIMESKLPVEALGNTEVPLFYSIWKLSMFPQDSIISSETGEIGETTS